MDRIKCVDGGLEIDGHYFISADRLDSCAKVLSWVLHLSDKSWVDTKLIGAFVRRCNSQYGVDVHFSC